MTGHGEQAAEPSARRGRGAAGLDRIFAMLPRLRLDSNQDKTAERAVARLSSFQEKHGAPTTAVLEYLGRRGVRVVVIGADGVYGDVALNSLSQAEQVCRQTGVMVKSWDRETSGLIAPSAADRRRMAGTGR